VFSFVSILEAFYRKQALDKKALKSNQYLAISEQALLYGLNKSCKSANASEFCFRFSKVFSSEYESAIFIPEIMKSNSIVNNSIFPYDICEYQGTKDKEFECKAYETSQSSHLDFSLRINRANIEFEVCAAAFLRGAFLTCGSITSPESEYHLEFNAVHKNLSEDLCKIIQETTEYVGGRAIKPKVVCRRGSYVVYLKDSEDISDILTLMGAGNASMNVMQIKIMKNYENAKNRQVNSQLANTDKIVSAAAKQVKAITILDESGKLGTLSEELQEAARVRKQYPLVSLKELCTYFDTPISKSGLNHRLNKLIELADLKDSE